MAFLRRRADVDPRRIAVVGSSIGGATAVLAMTGPTRRRLRAAVAISPPTASPLEALMERDRDAPATCSSSATTASGRRWRR